jgi:hypothetical protein
VPRWGERTEQASGLVERVESVRLVARSMADQLRFVARQAESMLPVLMDDAWAHAAMSELLGEAEQTLRLVNTLQAALATGRDGPAA